MVGMLLVNKSKLENMPSASEDNPEELAQFDLAEFVNEWSNLFVVMGVFAATAIYISQVTKGDIQDAQMTARLGFVASLILAALLFVLVYMKLKDEFGSLHRMYRAHFRLRNTPLLIFSLCSFTLSISLMSIVVSRQPVVLLLIMLAIVVLILGLASRFLEKLSNILPKSPSWRIPILLTISVAALVTFSVIHSELSAQYQITHIEKLSAANPFSIFANMVLLGVGVARSVSAMAVLVSILGVPIVIFDKMRGRGT